MINKKVQQCKSSAPNTACTTHCRVTCTLRGSRSRCSEHCPSSSTDAFYRTERICSRRLYSSTALFRVKEQQPGIAPAVAHRSSVDRSSVDRSSVDRSSADRSSVNLSSVDRSSADLSSVDRSSADLSPACRRPSLFVCLRANSCCWIVTINPILQF